MSSRDQLVVRMPREEIDAVAALAGQHGYSTSELVRVVLRRAVKGALRIAPKNTEAELRPRAVA